MIKSILAWAGWPGAILVALLAIGLVGSVATIWIGAPVAAIPLVNLLALLLAPFLTVACYAAAGLLAFVVLRLAFAFVIRRPSVAQWTAGVLAVVAAAAVGIGLPRYWNAAAGLTEPAAQKAPAAAVLTKGSEIALIEQGEPPYVRCGSLCLSLLLEGQAQAVEVAATLREPAPLAVLAGKRFMLTAQTRHCLTGLRDYGLNGQNSEMRHDNFVQYEAVPREYDTCLDSREFPVDPARQLTLVDWRQTDLPTDTHRPGYSGPVSVVRTVTPIDGHTPMIHDARYRAGWKYSAPLFIWPYAGNAGFGTYFSPSISISYFRDPGFPDVLLPRFWRLLQGSELIGRRTAAWLDTVVARGTFSRRSRPATAKQTL